MARLPLSCICLTFFKFHIIDDSEPISERTNIYFYKYKEATIL